MATGNDSTFGRQLMSYIQSKLPYTTGNDSINNTDELNPKYKHFFKHGSRRSELIQKHAISTVKTGEDVPMGGFNIDKKYLDYMYANIDLDKEKRIRDYRIMGAHAEVADALDEICDECIVEDDNGDILKLKLDYDKEFTTNERGTILKEFDKFIENFELKEKGWEHFRSILVDGEVYFEHVIHEDHKDAGILGIMNVPTELMDPVYDNVQNTIVKGYLLKKPVLNPQTGALDKYEFIPFDKNQMTYINSGIWNQNKSLRLPFIENCRRAYRQLLLMEDAIIIYRLVRAPERLVFNVDVGNMAPPKAEAYLRKLIQNYWSRKTFDNTQEGSGKTQVFNPQSMLDSFWFAKRQGSEGTQVSNLEGGANLGELDDLIYFMKKLYKSLKVPVNRLNPESQLEDASTVLREELKFARFVIRLQQNFAVGLQHGFITHLKMRGMWDEMDIHERDLTVEFNPPRNYHELRQQQIFELQYNNFSQMTQNESISNLLAQKKYLKWTDEEVKANREFLRKDKELNWELAQIESGGPNWREQFDQANAEPPPGGDLAAPAPMGGGLGAPPPDFGAPAETGIEPGGDAPVDIPIEEPPA
tara:strand:- start:450 stop:2213 length:1764 start_codon:yes stop_codon:yes gene_type:complete